MRRVAVLTGLILSMCAVGGGAAAGLTPKADANGVIVFESNRDGDFDIYAVNPDGTGLTQLTHNDDEDSSPRPSPDGRLIAFYSAGGLTLMAPDGSGRRSVTGCIGPVAAWSPDSTRVVCEGDDFALHVADVASGALTTLASHGDHASWSPDGSTIAFIEGERLWVAPAEGGDARRIGRHQVVSWETPSWSPDSRRIAYSAFVGDEQDVFTIGVHGSGNKLLARAAESPQWSPNGSQIAFAKELPRYVRAIYTARTDGKGLKRVSVSPGGESSLEPTWSADGAVLLYTRLRYRDSEETDVFVATLGSGRNRAVTHPFPAGGSNSDPGWMIGPPLAGREPTPRTIALPLARKRTFAEPIGGVATDGSRAVPSVNSASNRSGASKALVWDAGARRTLHTPNLCASSGFVLAGKRLAWLCYDSGNTYLATELETLRLGARRPRFVTETVADPNDGTGWTIGNLVGHGSTIAFTTFEGKNRTAKAWLLLSRRGKKCPRNSDLIGGRARPLCRRLTGAAGGATMAVDAGRVLTASPGGLVRILSTRDRVLRSWSLGPGVVNARLRGRTLAVQRDVSLDVFDASTGEKRKTLPLAADEGIRPYLLDVQGDLAVYVTGGAIHLLRVSSGRDAALAIPGAAPWLDARLEPSGLFVTWNQMYHRRRGRMAFVPMRTVVRAFDPDQSFGRPS
jgi:Tol biopolymer transport system component